MNTHLLHIRDTRVGEESEGMGITGLSPVFRGLRYVETGLAVASALLPVIRELGWGWYEYTWDVVTSGPAVGEVDAGSSVVSELDRYIPVLINHDAAERADLVVQLMNNKKSAPTSGTGTKTVYDRDGGETMATSQIKTEGSYRTETPDKKL